MDVYGKVLERRFSFSPGGHRLRYVECEEIRPFASWAEDKNPRWFRLSSKFKHDYLALAAQYTIGHALQSFVPVTMVVNHWRNPSIHLDRQLPIVEGVLTL